MAAPFHYSLFGLHLRSDIELPELPETAADRLVDVEILVGAAPDIVATGPGPHPIDGGLLLVVDAVARYAVVNGDRIIVEPRPCAADQNVRLFLLGSAMAILLHWRGLLPLHANAVEINGRAVCFLGASGEGKSTLAAWFHDRGHRILADDVCVVRFDEHGRPLATPGVPRLRLWAEALHATGRQPSFYDRSYAGSEDYDKYDVPIAPENTVTAERELAAIYLLQSGDAPKIEHLCGLDQAEAIFSNTYRGRYLSSAGNPQVHWDTCLKLIRRTPIFLARRTRDLTRFDQEAQAILAHAELVIAQSR